MGDVTCLAVALGYYDVKGFWSGCMSLRIVVGRLSLELLFVIGEITGFTSRLSLELLFIMGEITGFAVKSRLFYVCNWLKPFEFLSLKNQLYVHIKFLPEECKILLLLKIFVLRKVKPQVFLWCPWRLQLKFDTYQSKYQLSCQF